jgi:hypothetical protein
MCPLLYMFDGKYVTAGGRAEVQNHTTVFRGSLSYSWNQSLLNVQFSRSDAV